MTQLELEGRINDLESEVLLLKKYISKTLDLISNNTDAINNLNEVIKLMKLAK